MSHIFPSVAPERHSLDGRSNVSLLQPASPASSEKDESATTANKENDKPSRSKLRRQRKQRLKALIQQKLLGYKETPGQVLTSCPVPEDGPPVETKKEESDDDDDASSRKLYDNLRPDDGPSNEETVAVVENYPKTDSLVESDVDMETESGKVEDVEHHVTRDGVEIGPDVVVELVGEKDVNVARCEMTDAVTSDVEESVYELVPPEVLPVVIQPVLALQSDDEVHICTDIPAYFLPPRRYLDVISEENSDLSDADRPWENSEKIRQINAIESIPEDWFGSHDGIDTSWRDGKSLEDMSDVPVVTDSFSDSEMLFDDKKPTGSKSPPSVVNIVSGFYSKEKLRPIQIETVKNRGLLQGPNSEVVEIVYLDSSDSEAISSCKSETNLAITPLHEIPCEPDFTPKEGIDKIQKQSSINSEANSEVSLKSASPNTEIFVSDDKISEMISNIEQSVQEIISSSSEQLSCTSPASFCRRSLEVESERCRSVPVPADVNRSTRSVCSESELFASFHDSSDESSQSTTRGPTGVATLRELSMSAVLRLPFGISFLKQLGFDQSEYDSYSGYMPEGSEYSFSSKQPFSEGEYVVVDTEDDDSLTCDLPSLSIVPHQEPTEKWVGVQIPSDTQILLALTPTVSKPVKICPPNAVDLLDLHKKFVERRGYHEPESKYPTTTPTNDDELDDLTEFRALREYHALRQQKMRQTAQKTTEIGTNDETKIDGRVEKGDNPSVNETKELSAVAGSDGSEIGNSRLLELIQSEEFKGSTDPVNMNSATYAYWILLNRQNGTDDGGPSQVDAPAPQNDERLPDVRPRDEPQKTRPKSVPPSGEKFRQLMYEEYMDKLAELSERRRLKALKLSEPSKSTSTPSIPEIDRLKGEFMGKVKERMVKLGLTDEFVVVDGSLLADKMDEAKSAEVEKKLPRHVQELMDLTDEFDIIGKEGLLVEIDEALSPERKGFLTAKGVWSPVQSPENEKKTLEFADKATKNTEEKNNEEPTPAVWTPRSAGPSPTLGRKFRPVHFESPPPQRKNYPPAKDQAPELPKSLPAETSTSTTDTCASLSSSSRLTSSTSENSTLTSSQLRLPSSQNPTITLLQKAREGHIPKGAQYLEDSSPDCPSIVSPDEVVYSVKKEYTTADEEGIRKVVELTPKKFSGIGPTTREGVPIGLKSEVTENNQQRWYKRMYDSLHKTADRDKDFVTVTYKTRRKGQYPYSSFRGGGYTSEPERLGYDSDASISKYATLDRRKIRNKENDFTTSTLPRNRYAPAVKHAVNVYKNQPGRIEDYEPGNSSIAEIEKKQWWDEVLDIFDGELTNSSKDVYATPHRQSFTTYALKDTGYDSDSTLVFKRRENMSDSLSPAEQRMAYKVVQRGGEVPLHGLRKAIPERPKEPIGNPIPTPPRDHASRLLRQESPHRYVESEVNIHYKSPVRSEAKAAWPEDELAEKQAEIMRRIYQEQRRTKYLNELHDMYSRRHTDNLLPSQKSPIPLNRYDDFPLDPHPPRPRDRTPEPKLVARALYNFVGQSSRELSFRRGDIIYVRRQIDKNWYEGEHNAMIGLFPFNYVEIIPYDGIRTLPKKANEGQARAKFNFQAQTHLELSLVKGELVLLTRRVDENWFEGRIGSRKGIFPVSYVEVLVEPGERVVSPSGQISTKPVVAPASHSVMLNGAKDIGQQHYQPPRPALYSSSSLPPQSRANDISLVSQSLHIDTQSDPVPYRVLYNYKPQNDDELELKEGDVVYVMEKCDDGWYVGSLHRNGQFGTFPGNYVERILQ